MLENSSSTSFSNLSSTSSPSPSSSDSDSEDVDPFDKYDPYFLDDPELRAGRHCTVVALAGYYASLSHYVPAERLKEELNSQFYSRHAHHIHQSLSLTKIRSLKARMIEVALECDLELTNVAQAFVYLEKLILCKVVTRMNRQVAASCCLLLAAKASDYLVKDISQVLNSLCRNFGISKKSLILKMEFSVFAGLRFDLHILQGDYLPHLERILVDLPYSNLQEYLGERMYQFYQKNKVNK